MKNTLIILVLLLITQAVSAQWLGGYSFRKEVTINESKVSGTSDLIDFPLLLSTTDGDLASIASGGKLYSIFGWDISFTMMDGTTLLDHEIESYSATTGNLICWIRIPFLDSDLDTKIYMYYGKSGVSIDPSTINTWNTSYLGVWHHHENTLDASQNLNHGTNYGTTSVTGKIGNARVFDGVDDYIRLINTDLYDNVAEGTIVAWAKWSGSNFETIFGADSGPCENPFEFAIESGSLTLWADDEECSGDFHASSPITNPADWHQLVYVVDGTGNSFFIDGIKQTPTYHIGSQSTTFFLRDSDDETTIYEIGRSVADNGEAFSGIIDEIRLLNVPMDEDWVKTTFDNQDNPSGFYSISAAESSNDSPCEATILTVNTSCNLSTYTNQDASDSGVPLSQCGGYTGSDIWFKASVPASGSLVAKIETNTTTEHPNPSEWINRVGLAVYSGDCGSPVYESCQIYTAPGPVINPEITLTGYSPGETLYFRIWGEANEKGYFSICIYEDASIPPVITCPENIIINCDDDSTPTGTGSASATDDQTAVGDIVITYSDVSTRGTDPANTDYYNYTITRTWTAEDEAANTSNCDQIITVQDITAPAFSCPGDIAVDLDPNCEYTVPDFLTSINISDGCDANPTSSQSPVQGTILSGAGTVQEIVIIALDVSGNSQECRFNITLIDNSLPEVVSLRDTLIILEEGSYFVDLVLPNPIFSDNCGLSSIVNDFNGLENASGNYAFGTTLVGYTVSDINGNTENFSHEIEVQISDMPANGLIIPEGISPNNDGLNDRFVILGLEKYPVSSLQIFNSVGNKVYSSADYNNEWDGISNTGGTKGKELAGGNYYYIIYLPNDKGVIKGLIYLQRD